MIDLSLGVSTITIVGGRESARLMEACFLAACVTICMVPDAESVIGEGSEGVWGVQRRKRTFGWGGARDLGIIELSLQAVFSIR